MVEIWTPKFQRRPPTFSVGSSSSPPLSVTISLQKHVPLGTTYLPESFLLKYRADGRGSWQCALALVLVSET